jgi:hypothetical protein
MRRQLRRSGRHDRFLRTARQTGEATLTWGFVRKVFDVDDHQVTIHGWFSEGVFRLYCLGPQAESAVERVNKLLRPSLPSWWNVARKRYSYKARRKREDWLRAKRQRLEKKRIERAAKKSDQQKRSAVDRAFVPSPISLKRNELLTPQFRKSRIFWREAIRSTVAIFDIHGNGRYTARELAAQELWRSLERSGYRFAQYKRRGFSLRFDLVDGIWRGDITPIHISCTKDNDRKEYRRMRAHFRDVLLGIPKESQAVRRGLLYDSSERIAA